MESRLAMFVVAGVLLVAVATAQTTVPKAPTALPPGRTALPPNLAPKALATTQSPSWVQREGYVPVPDALVRPAAPAKAPNALPPANPWATIDLDKPFENDPLGTNVYSDPKYAPANVQAAIEAQKDREDEDSTAAVWAKPKNQGFAGGMGSGGAGAGSLGGDGAGAMAPGQGAMLQQSYSQDAPVGPAAASIGAGAGLDAVGPAAASTGAGAGGLDAVGPAAASTGAGAGGAGDDSVFAGGSGSAFNNRYTPSVGNAMGSSDLIVQMIVEAPEQQTALGADAIRSVMGRMTNTPPGRIFVYQTRTINNPDGQPFTSISFLFKNNLDAERSRQASTFGSGDIMRGFTTDVAKAAKLKVSPGSIKVNSAVNDGGMAGGGVAGAAMPGQQIQMGMGPAQTGGMMMMPPAAPTPVPAAPAKSSGQRAESAGVLSAVAVVLAALVAV